MSLHDEVEQRLQELTGWSGEAPQTFSASTDSGAEVVLDLTTVDRLACGWQRLTIDAKTPAPLSPLQFRTVGQNLCRRLAYLLEPLQVVECDPEIGTMQIRSAPPQREGETVRYYELAVQRNGQLDLHRYTATRGVPGRAALEIVTTRETLHKLIPDLVDCLQG